MPLARQTIILALALLLVVTSTRADTYSTFVRTEYYSANREYFVVVTDRQLATMYRVESRGARRLWTHVLPQLPGHLLVTNDGSRVALIDRYYGNGHNPNTPAVIWFNQNGNEIARHTLADVADLSRVITTTSASHWYSNVAFTPDESALVIDTIVAKRDPATCTHVNSAEEANDCGRSIPHEQLRFETASGKLLSRTTITATAGRV
jgi:hypothetical protein